MVSNVVDDMKISNMVHGKIAISGFFQTLANTIGATDLFVPIEKSLILNGDVSMIDKQGNKILISEKAQTKFINKPIPSFTLELGYYNEVVDLDNFRLGWLLDDSIGITHYMLIWILEADNDAKKIKSYNEIHKVRICMIKRSNIFKMFTDNNLEISELVDRATTLVMNPPESQYGKYKEEIRKGMTLVQSLEYKEKPVNLKVDFDLYLRYADFTVDCDLDNNVIKTVNSWEDKLV